ncbi:hypothetical protein RHMOL_Rhmol04G0221800 [Rhododendron molle]|uniref:Uncharacterized protein n=1 Tax=Rhododendron molle TaxID=49168 RepID=A0ACC0P338_RHOML|nr:hypothetical protein RHMOL_Rhmol04G0221800 [Rhododendron molle]
MVDLELAGLVDLEQAGRFDWGGASLCTLYCFLGVASHGVGNTIGGYWRVVELWAYEVLGMFPPENTCRDPGLFPRGLAWSKTYMKTKEKRGQVFLRSLLKMLKIGTPTAWLFAKSDGETDCRAANNELGEASVATD